MNEAMNANQLVHPFQLAGLGTAPYRFIGTDTKIFRAAPDAPAQPGSSCDFCGTAIMQEFWLRSADGKVFKVGCDCVLKTTHKGVRVRSEVERERNKMRTEANRARIMDRIHAAWDALHTNTAVVERVKSQPHPYGWAREKGLSRYDYWQWLRGNAGYAGQKDLACAIERELEAK